MPRKRNDYRTARLYNSPERPEKIFVIAAEGDKKEINYFQAVRNKYGDDVNLHIEILERPEEEVSKSAPQFVEKMIDTFMENNRDYDFQEYDELWIVIDTDDHSVDFIKQLAKKCNEISLYHLGLSNPCFEIWLILHFTAINTELKKEIEVNYPKRRAGYCKELCNNYWQEYRIGSYEDVLQYTGKAVDRGKELGTCDPKSEYFPENVCTSVYKLLDKIIN